MKFWKLPSSSSLPLIHTYGDEINSFLWTYIHKLYSITISFDLEHYSNCNQVIEITLKITDKMMINT